MPAGLDSAEHVLNPPCRHLCSQVDSIQTAALSSNSNGKAVVKSTCSYDAIWSRRSAIIESGHLACGRSWSVYIEVNISLPFSANPKHLPSPPRKMNNMQKHDGRCTIRLCAGVKKMAMVDINAMAFPRRSSVCTRIPLSDNA